MIEKIKTNLNINNSFIGVDNYYHYFYKITNLVNNHFYYGVHSTKNLYDGYIGSGTRLHKAYKKYGFNSFIKEVIEYFNTEEEMLEKELEVVNEDLILNNECYNIAIGGGKSLFNKVITKNCKGEIFKVSLNDSRLYTGELIGVAKNTVTVKDKEGNNYRIPIETFNKNKNIFCGVTTGKVIVHDSNMNTFLIDVNDNRYKSGEFTFLLKTINKDITTVRDKDNNTYRINKNDIRLKTGEFVGITKGKLIMLKDDVIKFINPDELEQYEKDGWINTNKSKGKLIMLKDDVIKLINPDELEQYEKDGWKKGSNYKSCLGKIAINKYGNRKFINPDEFEQYEKDGWKKGLKSK